MTLEPKIVREVAEPEVNKWLDLKKIPTTTRKAHQKNFDNIVNAVMHDAISFDEKGVITHKLNFPIEDKDGNPVCSEFKYKLRLTVDEIQACLSAGGDTQIYGAALTSANPIPAAYFGKLDTTDLSILSSIVVFFTC